MAQQTLNFMQVLKHLWQEKNKSVDKNQMLSIPLCWRDPYPYFSN